MRTFDELNEIFSNMTEQLYKLTEQAASAYYQHGDTAFAESVSRQAGITVDELLSWW